MGAENLGPWQPLTLKETVALFAAYPSRWWITGGVALELFVGRSWRAHEDSDVSVLRHEVAHVRALLVDWDLHLASGGRLAPWDGKAARAVHQQNNLWCRPRPDDPWCLDVTISDGDDGAWVYRRDPTLRLPWPDAVLRSPDGIPYLSPELQLLFKSKNCRPKDNDDAAQVIPHLEGDRRQRLRDALPEDHAWRSLLT